VENKIDKNSGKWYPELSGQAYMGKFIFKVFSEYNRKVNANEYSDIGW
jgi:hypothetical protein